MKALKDLFQREVVRQGTVDEKTAFFLFQRIVRKKYGDRGMEMIQPISLKNTVLSIKTKSPLWANELGLAESELLRELKEELGDGVITTLRFYS